MQLLLYLKVGVLILRFEKPYQCTFPESESYLGKNAILQLHGL